MVHHSHPGKMLKNFPSVIKKVFGLLLAVKLRKEYQRGNLWN